MIDGRLEMWIPQDAIVQRLFGRWIETLFGCLVELLNLDSMQRGNQRNSNASFPNSTISSTLNAPKPFWDFFRTTPDYTPKRPVSPHCPCRYRSEEIAHAGVHRSKLNAACRSHQSRPTTLITCRRTRYRGRHGRCGRTTSVHTWQGSCACDDACCLGAIRGVECAAGGSGGNRGCVAGVRFRGGLGDRVGYSDHMGYVESLDTDGCGDRGRARTDDAGNGRRRRKLEGVVCQMHDLGSRVGELTGTAVNLCSR